MGNRHHQIQSQSRSDGVTSFLRPETRRLGPEVLRIMEVRDPQDSVALNYAIERLIDVARNHGIRDEKIVDTLEKWSRAVDRGDA